MKRSFPPIVTALFLAICSNALADPSAPAPAASTPPASATATAADAPRPIDPAKRALIEELLKVMRTEEELDGLAKAILSQAPDIVEQIQPPAGAGLTPAQQDEADQQTRREIQRFQDLFKQDIDILSIARSVAFNLYDKYFTADEIKDLIAFYKTPTGQKAVDILPQLSQESMRLTEDALAPKIKAIVRQMQDEAAKANTSTPAPSK